METKIEKESYYINSKITNSISK